MIGLSAATANPAAIDLFNGSGRRHAVAPVARQDASKAVRHRHGDEIRVDTVRNRPSGGFRRADARPGREQSGPRGRHAAALLFETPWPRRQPATDAAAYITQHLAQEIIREAEVPAPTLRAHGYSAYQQVSNKNISVVGPAGSVGLNV